MQIKNLLMRALKEPDMNRGQLKKVYFTPIPIAIGTPRGIAVRQSVVLKRWRVEKISPPFEGGVAGPLVY